MPPVFGGEEFSNWAHAPRKDPEEKVRHEVTFSDRLADTDRISSASWAGDPSGDLSFGSVSAAGGSTEAIVGAGESGTFYRVTATIETSDGLVLKRGYTLPVGDIYAEPEDLSMRRAAFMARQFLRDRPADNELNFGELQSSFDDMRRAVRSALSDWNSTQPHTSHDLDQFPVEARRLLYQKTAVETLRSAAQSEGRNQYSYSDQGFSAEENSHAPAFMQFAQRLNAEYEKKKQKYKAASNAQRYWGGMSIDERYGNGAFGDHLH
jgi:hypothetical protein